MPDIYDHQEDEGIHKDPLAPTTGLASHIKSVWETHRLSRQKIDARLLACLRARKGVYSESELAAIRAGGGSSEIYHPITSTKCRAASAWVSDVLLRSEKPAWGFDPTTLPDLPPEMEQVIRNKAQASIIAEMDARYQAAVEEMQAAQAPPEPDGEQMAEGDQGPDGQEPEQAMPAGQALAEQPAIDPASLMTEDEALDMIRAARDEFMDEQRKAAKRAAQRAEQEVLDQMDEGGWLKALSEFIEDAVTYPAAILKGPYYTNTRQLEWGPNWQPQVVNKLKPHWRRVSPFDVYPSATSDTPQEGDFIERMSMSPSELYACIGVPGYSEEAIRRVLENGSTGQLAGWLWADFERKQLESESNFWVMQQDNNYDALHYWGSVQGYMLSEWGMEVDDPVDFYEIDAILIGGDVVSAAINRDPMGTRPYHATSYDKIPGSFWGNSIPELMDDVQKMTNGTARALANNLALSSGPQIGLFSDMLAPGENITEMHPFKIWQFASQVGGLPAGTQFPIQFFQPDIRSNEYLSVLERYEVKADDATGIPRYAYGSQRTGGAGQTASGLSMLMESSGKGIRKFIANIDFDVIKPTVTQAWMMLMTDPDTPEDAKGDCNVVARGSSAELIKESMREARTQMFQLVAGSELAMSIVGKKGAAQMLRQIAQSYSMETDRWEHGSDRDSAEDKKGNEQLAQAQQELQAMAQQLQQEKQALEGEKAQITAERDSVRAQKDKALADIDRRILAVETREAQVQLRDAAAEIEVDAQLNRALSSIRNA